MLEYFLTVIRILAVTHNTYYRFCQRLLLSLATIIVALVPDCAQLHHGISEYFP